MNIVLITLAIIPGFAICWFIFHSDKYEKENVWHLGLTFLLGIVVTYPTMLLEEQAIEWGWDGQDGLLDVLFYALFGIAFIEEIMKTLCVFIYPYHRKFFNEPMDGIVYSVIVGMGFATLENIIYATNFGLETTLVRAFTAVPAHGIFGIIVGYYLGLAKFGKKNPAVTTLKGLALAILLHGIYDFFLLQEWYDWLSIFAIITLIGSYVLAKRFVLLHIQNSPFKELKEDQVAYNIPEEKNWDKEIEGLLDTQENEGLGKE